MSDLSVYGKALKERSALLKEMSLHPERTGELDVWDMQIVEYGSRIIRRRRNFIHDFREIAAEKHLLLTDGNEHLELIYEPSVTEDEFAEKLYAGRDTDIRMKTTGFGPHRDDMAVISNGMDLRPFGSQGQQRTAALSMKLAEIETVKNEKHEMPVLLLDDVLSELDRDRQNALLSTIRDTQTLITCTGMDESVRERLSADRIFHVKSGNAEAVNINGSIG